MSTDLYRVLPIVGLGAAQNNPPVTSTPVPVTTPTPATSPVTVILVGSLALFGGLGLAYYVTRPPRTAAQLTHEEKRNPAPPLKPGGATMLKALEKELGHAIEAARAYPTKTNKLRVKMIQREIRGLLRDKQFETNG